MQRVHRLRRAAGHHAGGHQEGGAGRAGRAAEPVKKATTTKKATSKKAAAAKKASPPPEPDGQTKATALLVRATRVGLQKSDDEWVYAGGVKSQMQRMDPAFKEKSLGFSSFRAFVESRAETVESKVDGNGQLMVKLP